MKMNKVASKVMRNASFTTIAKEHKRQYKFSCRAHEIDEIVKREEGKGFKLLKRKKAFGLVTLIFTK